MIFSQATSLSSAVTNAPVFSSNLHVVVPLTVVIVITKLVNNGLTSVVVLTNLTLSKIVILLSLLMIVILQS